MFAAQYWWDNNGSVPSHLIASKLIINNEKLTRLIRDQMANKTGIEIPDETPVVEVEYTKESLDKKYPRREHGGYPFSLEMFYYLAHPENLPPCSNPTFKN
jgi:hypothetical protein